MCFKTTFSTILGLIIVLSFNNSFSQTLMGEAGYPESSPADCSTFGTSGTNFQDDGGATDYSANFNGTTVFCPDLNTGTKMTITFAINAGYTFDVDASDSIYIYDGPDASAPLLGAHNSDTDPNGFAYTATWDNPSGCLTVVFISDGATEGTGWDANVACGNQPQPFETHIEAFINGQGSNALVPLDTGNVDICFEDSVLLVAVCDFPYAQEVTGYGYSQDISTNIDFEWNITDGGTYANNDSIWFSPPTRNGFYVDLQVTDQFPQSEFTYCKVRVSQLPLFAGTGPDQNPICLGDSSNLIGGTTASDTAGVEIPPGSFQLGGNYAGLTYLPDGSGAQYQAPIEISGFPAGSTISNSQDLNDVCITMEHSYLGDLEIALECPNGTQVTLINSYSPGFIPGGTSGGGTYLGDPIDDAGGGGPGEGWEYCFSSVFNDWGDYPTELGNGNTVPANNFGGGGASMNPDGVYLPEEDFSTFAGCPVNGEWTIIVQDNIGIDDGYIFEWGLFFDPSYFPGLEAYQNYIVSEEWDNDPTIISDQNDTLIVVLPETTGDFDYTYNVVDDFGCAYDTTVTLTVLETAEIFNDTLACDFELQVQGTSSDSGGEWSSVSPEITFTTPTDEDPLITSSAPGEYTVTYIDNTCNDTIDRTITFAQLPEIFSDTLVCTEEFQIVADSIESYGGGYWSIGAGTGEESFTPSAGELAPLFTGDPPYNYILTYTDSVCGNEASAALTMLAEPTVTAPDLSCFYTEDNIVFTSYGTVNIVDNPDTPFLEDTAFHLSTGDTIPTPGTYSTYVSEPGTYIIEYTDDFCNITVTEELTFQPFVFTQILDSAICSNAFYNMVALTDPNATNYEWSTGVVGTNEITVNQEGWYWVTASNTCHEHTDSAYVETYLCEIEPPNVVSLSSKAGNNTWFVNSSGIKEFECHILNRWGNVVYKLNDVNDSWNGTNRSTGKRVNEGTYYYQINATTDNDQEIEKHGFIQVIH